MLSTSNDLQAAQRWNSRLEKVSSIRLRIYRSNCEMGSRNILESDSMTVVIIYRQGVYGEATVGINESKVGWKSPYHLELDPDLFGEGMHSATAAATHELGRMSLSIAFWQKH